MDGKVVPSTIPPKLFVEIRHQKTAYESVTQLVESLVTDENYKFKTRPLPPGRYLLSFVGTVPKPDIDNNIRLGFRSPAPQARKWKYRIVVPEADEPIQAVVFS